MKKNFPIIVLTIGCLIGLLGFFVLGFEPKLQTTPSNISNTVWETEQNKFLLHINSDLLYEDGQISTKKYVCYPENAKPISKEPIVINGKTTNRYEIIVEQYHFEDGPEIYRFGCTFTDKYDFLHLETFWYQIKSDGYMNFLYPISRTIAQPLYNLKRVK